MYHSHGAWQGAGSISYHHLNDQLSYAHIDRSPPSFIFHLQLKALFSLILLSMILCPMVVFQNNDSS